MFHFICLIPSLMQGDRPRFQALECGCLFRSLIQPHTVHLGQVFLLAKYIYLIPGLNPLQHQLLCPKAHLKIVSTKYQTSSSRLVWVGLSEWCILSAHPLCGPVKLENTLFASKIQWWDRHRMTIIDIPVPNRRQWKEGVCSPKQFENSAGQIH